ncbi:MAG: HyaD/HybD family hydrogenase maturation endopeptidase [Negativicutes bacterium]|nr:HyaD/HybD family hydrogenase maturation endopeptidase [Negativicutes bacterium]
MEKVIVLGIGNLLLSDEGFGVKVVEMLLSKYKIPPGVEIIDGGTMGYELLRFLHGADKLIIIDAINGDKPPGAKYRFAGDEVKTYYRQKVSMHQLGIKEVLAMLDIQQKPIAEIVVLGVQPASLELGCELSSTVAPMTEIIAEEIISQLAAWRQVPPSPDHSKK